MGCDLYLFNLITIKRIFLLTHPVWDVTVSSFMSFILSGISTHTSRVGCDKQNLATGRQVKISTHTSRVGCDSSLDNVSSSSSSFLLTHPVWDVTYVVAPHDSCTIISTHTSRVGCDYISLILYAPTPYYFYSHIPCGM